ncbi:RNA polymerase sigma-70 factor (family 1) [Chitinophaga sp. W3I9]|uniref:RNA polymerase sigma factor n=1 Tax=unclassified Chitinophaga TaxID=2619133 RepID=UPI003D1A78DF
MSNNNLNTEPDERETLKLVALGDERAFSRIVRKYSQVIYPYLLYWLKSPQLAEEVAQDVFLRLWKNRHKLPDISNFSGYVYVVSRNCVNSQFERGLLETAAPDVAQIDLALTNPQTDLETKELATIMGQAIESLPPRRKEVFLLSRNEQLTYEEIAARLGISRSTVREHMVEALVFLRTYLKRNAGIIITLLWALINLL